MTERSLLTGPVATPTYSHQCACCGGWHAPHGYPGSHHVCYACARRTLASTWQPPAWAVDLDERDANARHGRGE